MRGRRPIAADRPTRARDGDTRELPQVDSEFAAGARSAVQRGGATPRRIVTHLVLIWLASAVGLVVAGFLAVLAFALKFAPLLMPVLVLQVLLVYLAGSFVRGVAPLAATAGRRLVWAAVVTVAGTLGAVFVLAVLDVRGEGDFGWAGLMLIVVPFPLIAVVLVGHWMARLVGAAVIVGTVVLGSGMPGSASSDAVWTEFTSLWARLAEEQPDIGDTPIQTEIDVP